MTASGRRFWGVNGDSLPAPVSCSFTPRCYQPVGPSTLRPTFGLQEPLRVPLGTFASVAGVASMWSQVRQACQEVVKLLALVAVERCQEPCFAGEQQLERVYAEPVAGGRERYRVCARVVGVALAHD